MRVYGHAYRDTMKLPIKVFWQLSGNAPRLWAGERRDMLELSTVATHNPEAASTLFAQLATEAPEPVVLTGRAIVAATSIRDEEGFNELRSMS